MIEVKCPEDLVRFHLLMALSSLGVSVSELHDPKGIQMVISRAERVQDPESANKKLQDWQVQFEVTQTIAVPKDVSKGGVAESAATLALYQIENALSSYEPADELKEFSDEFNRVTFREIDVVMRDRSLDDTGGMIALGGYARYYGRRLK